MIAVEVVGVCGACGGPVMLQFEKGRRSAVCVNCPTLGIPEAFFKECGLGDAARISALERRANRRGRPDRWDHREDPTTRALAAAAAARQGSGS